VTGEEAENIYFITKLKLYAGNLFITLNNEYKQRDCNIRRGGRSTIETLVMLGEPNYEAEAETNISIEKELTSGVATRGGHGGAMPPL
jgi:hypothetical protein